MSRPLPAAGWAARALAPMNGALPASAMDCLRNVRRERGEGMAWRHYTLGGAYLQARRDVEPGNSLRWREDRQRRALEIARIPRDDRAALRPHRGRGSHRVLEVRPPERKRGIDDRGVNRCDLEHRQERFRRGRGNAR